MAMVQQRVRPDHKCETHEMHQEGHLMVQLDPQMKAVLDQAAAAGGKPFHQMTPAEARAAIDSMFAAFRGKPVEVGRVEDRKIPGLGGQLPIRIYSPAGAGPFGALVYFHGGGWVIGNIETHDATCRELTASAGCVTISVDYRLAPEHRFPAGPEDCYSATKWAAESGHSPNIDPNRIAVGGDSAGGNLAAAVALMARDRGGPRLAFQLLIYPATDAADDTPSQHEFAQASSDYLLSRADMEWFWGHYLAPGDKTNPVACPARAGNLANLPPAFVQTAEIDPLRDEGEAYAEALRKAGGKVKMKRYNGVCHGFYSMASMIDIGKQAIADSCAELCSAIGK
jgi:acetyl esterase